jgi:3-oxoacyl-[acyl-carrier protein] reductase
VAKRVVVTGISRGIGFAMLRSLHQAGYQVIGISRQPPPPGTTLIDNFQWLQADLSALDRLPALAREITADGPIYGLVNNAGISREAFLTRFKVEDMTAIMHMNAVVPMAMTKLLLGSMMAARTGRVINMSSIVATTGYRGLSVYAASKAAMLGFTKSLAREVGPLGITVNAIAPGFVETELTSGLTEDEKQTIRRRSALKRMVSPEDVSQAVVYLLSEQAANITGTVLTVDAGNTT